MAAQLGDLLASRESSLGARRAVAFSLVLLAAGCSSARFAVRERAAIQQHRLAERAEAAALAPYEYVTSSLYLTKAREEAAQAHYTLALSLLARAEQSATQARLLAHARHAGARP